jgi:hypothetical protein
MIHRWVPDVEALPNNGMKAQFHFLRNKAPWLIIAATFLGNGGILCWFSYISPLLQMEGGFSAASISLLMILAGGGMVVGNQVSALLADRFKPGRFTCYLQFLAAAALLLTFFLAPFSWVSVVLMFICCACLFGIVDSDGFELKSKQKKQKDISPISIRKLTPIQMPHIDIEELKTGKFANIAERSGRAQDKEDGGGLEELRKDGYM